jgi:hypothetical protein
MFNKCNLRGSHMQYLTLIIDDSIGKVRSAVKYVKSSLVRFEKFKFCMEREKLTFKNLLCLDVPTRWNSTFKMLEGAEKCQSAFELMEEYDVHFVSSLFDEKNDKKKFGTSYFC